ncbi:MAG: hypothetical protein WCQ95_02215 [Bacteroidota bacterium]
MQAYDKLRLDVLHRIQIICDLYAVQLALIILYPPLKALLDAIVLKIEVARQINAQNITNFTTTKEVTCVTMVETCFKFMLRGAIKAAALNLPALEQSLSMAKSQIYRNDDATIAVKCEIIRTILNSNIATLTNILPADITLMEDTIKAYNLALDAPKVAIDKRSSFGTQAIHLLLNQADAHKINMGKLFHAYLDNEAIAAFDLIAKIGKPSGRRHTSIIIKYLDAEKNVPIIRVKTTITKGDQSHVKISSKLGLIRAFSLEVGVWNVTSENNLYEPTPSLSLPISDNQIQRVTVLLNRIGSPVNPTPNPDTSGFGQIYGNTFNSETNDPIEGALVYYDTVAEPCVTDEDGDHGNDHVSTDCKNIRATADGFANYFKAINILPDQQNQFDIPMEPIAPQPPDQPA